MGVHDTQHYASVKKLLEIPASEPIFILRAQDRLSVEMIEHYRRFYTQRMMMDQQMPDAQFTADLDECISEFIDWQQRHPDDIKLPD
jgi:hypothetical protein